MPVRRLEIAAREDVGGGEGGGFLETVEEEDFIGGGHDDDTAGGGRGGSFAERFGGDEVRAGRQRSRAGHV